jgi:hypothetical protein
MSPEKYEQIWEDCILKTINKYISKNKSSEVELELAVDISKLKRDIWNFYEKYRKFFKSNYMAKNDKDEDTEISGGGNTKDERKIDRHKIAALLYLSIVYGSDKPFIRVKGERDKNIGIEASHKIAYSVASNIIYSFVDILNRKCSDPYKIEFLKNKGFQKSPRLICEEYGSYEESIIPRMTSMTANGVFNKNNHLICFHIIMLANIFYFLELYASS